MLIVPAIDIMGGQVVRLQRGDFQTPSVYGSSPLEFAKKWEAQGAQLLHIVDLDGAKTGELKNFKLIKEIIAGIQAKIEVGGGIRSSGSIRRYIKEGAQQVVLSTRLLEDDAFLLQEEVKDYLSQLVVSLDIKEMESSDIVTGAAGGWIKSRDILIDIPSFVRGIVSKGVYSINFSDISRDGTMEGPDIEKILIFLKHVRASVNVPMCLTYAGGISSLEDLKALHALGEKGPDAVIVGRALYENKFSLKEAIEGVR